MFWKEKVLLVDCSEETRIKYFIGGERVNGEGIMC